MDYLLEGFSEISWVIHRALFGNIQNEPTEEFINRSLVHATYS